MIYTVCMFGYLNTHSHYSLLRGVAKVPKLLEQAKGMGCEAIALTDTNNLYGAVEFYKAAREAEIKPILGVTLCIRHAPGTPLYPIVLLAGTETGYKNILQLTTDACFSEDTDRHITPEHLKQKTDGVIGLLPALYNPVRQSLTHNDTNSAKTYFRTYRELFGESLYIGISPQDPTPLGATTVPHRTEDIIALAKETGTGVIPLPLIYLLGEEEKVRGKSCSKSSRRQNQTLEEDLFEDPLIHPEPR